MPPDAAVLRGRGLGRRYGAVTALAGVSLDVAAGRVAAVLGPSGCGKSTLLRLLAGLEAPDTGSVAVDGRDVTADPAHRRPVGVVFQDHALFPHLDVRANVAFGLVEARWDRAAVKARVDELLDAFGLLPLARRRVDALSGGERQRVALGRALAPRPRVLLLDEPLASLDRSLRERLAADLARTLRDPSFASVFVTHDQDEALTVGDTIVVLRAGRVAQSGAAADVVERPVDAWVARFLGHRNVYEGDAARQLPGGDSSPAILLRDDLVRVVAPDAAGAGATARVLAVARERTSLRLDLHVDAWGVDVTWHGAARELSHVPSAGDSVGLVVPPDAWWPLAASPVEAP
jgi:ABC-type Fe3+/spermidine/putrescine transport system ATPase subunit